MSKAPYNDIFSYITAQEAAYAQPITLPTGKNWNMKDHLVKTELYNNSDIVGTKDDFTRVKNITRPILNLQHRTEDIEVKDVQLYVSDPNKYHLSFLVKKYHDDVFTVENDIDTYFDELNVSRIDAGGGLSKKLFMPRPEVVPLLSIAFCDQRDMLNRPIGLKHSYAPDELLDMADKGWGNTANGATVSLEELVVLARENPIKDVSDGDIQVYEVHGNLPKRFADASNNSEQYERRLFLVAFYQKQHSPDRAGVILYTALETENPFKLIKRDPIYGRALGFGGGEELFEAQIGVNYDIIRKQDMKDAAAMTIMETDDATVAAKHPSGLKDMQNMEIVEHAPGTFFKQVDTFPRNMQLFDKSIQDWEAHAQQIGAANDSIMGQSPASGTPFKLQELVTQESHGLHEYRRGQYAKHLEEIYTDWIIPHIEKKICEGTKFLSELSLEDLQYVGDCLVRNEVANYELEKVLSGQDINPDETKAFEQKVRDEFQRKGNKHFVEILKGEFKNVPLGVKVSIKGKSKDLSQRADKLSNIFAKIFANPQGFIMTMQIPGAAKAFTDLLESSGLDPQDFSNMDKAIAAMKAMQPPAPQPSPVQPQLAAQPQPQNA